MNELNRRAFLETAGFASAALALPQTAPGGAANRKRLNIVFIMADDHALEAISCYGGLLKDYAKTFNMDRSAREGMRFNNVCCNNSTCSPSRASILTGQYSHKNDVLRLNGTISDDSPWVPVELQEAGPDLLLACGCRSRG